MRLRPLATGAALVALVLPTLALAHTVYGRVIEAKPAVVEFKYSSGEPMTYADVAVFGPGSQEAYQTGRADAAGRFSFVASTKGDWRVEARDEDKHTARVTLQIAEDMDVRLPSQSYIEKALVLSLGLNIVAGLGLWQLRNRSSSIT